jgi:hypothetical protein
MARRPSLRRRRALTVLILASASLALVAAVLASCAVAASLQAAGATKSTGVGRGHGNRRWWKRERNLSWWEGDAQDLDDNEFRSHFRMDWNAFYTLADDLRPDIERKNTRFRNAVDYEAVVAMALYRLATGAVRASLTPGAEPRSHLTPCTGNAYRTIAIQFGTSKSVVQDCTKRVVMALVKRAPQWIHLPSSEEDVSAAAIASERLFHGTGIPSIVAQVDGSHIRVEYGDRRVGYMDWRSRKGYPAMNLMAMSDASSKFVAVNVGWAGSVGDARVFRNTSFGNRVLDSSIFNGMTISLPNHAEIPYCVAGDAAFPGCPCLLKPFADAGTLTDPQLWYNHVQSVQRQPIERAFGRLKGRWRTLKECATYDFSFVPHVIVACCVLHNFCETVAAGWDPALFVREDDDAQAWDAEEVEEDVQAVTGMVSICSR